MANVSLRLSCEVKRVWHALGLLCLMVMVEKGCGYEFKVGGSGGWAVPADSSTASYNQWAESKRFQIGDSLVFDYPAEQDSVLQVTNEDYTNCKTESPIASFTDGHTVFTFTQSGPHYFISGSKDHCLKNEKLHVVVMADRSNRTTNQTALSPPPSPSDMIPSPAPSGEESPPAGTVDVNPTPAPSADDDHPTPPPPSAASSVLVSFGVLMASAAVMAL